MDFTGIHPDFVGVHGPGGDIYSDWMVGHMVCKLQRGFFLFMFVSFTVSLCLFFLSAHVCFRIYEHISTIYIKMCRRLIFFFRIDGPQYVRQLVFYIFEFRKLHTDRFQPAACGMHTFAVNMCLFLVIHKHELLLG